MEDVRDKKIEPPIPVIISLSESKAEPQKGIGPSKDVVRKFLKEHNRPYRETIHERVSDQRPALAREGLPKLARTEARRSGASARRATCATRVPRE